MECVEEMITCEDLLSRCESTYFYAIISRDIGEVEFGRKDQQDGTSGSPILELSAEEWSDFLELVTHVDGLI